MASVNTISPLKFSFSAKAGCKRSPKKIFINLLNLNKSNSNKILEGRKSKYVHAQTEKLLVFLNRMIGSGGVSVAVSGHSRGAVSCSGYFAAA